MEAGRWLSAADCSAYYPYVSAYRDTFLRSILGGWEVSGLDRRKDTESHRFLRCGRQFLVNFRHIDSIEGSQLILSTGQKLPVGRAYKKSFLTDFARILGSGYAG